jgi:hypothetical protein
MQIFTVYNLGGKYVRMVWIPGICSHVGGSPRTWVPILNPDGGAVVLRVEGTLGHAAVQPRNVLVAAKVRQVRVDNQILCNGMGLVRHFRSAAHSQEILRKANRFIPPFFNLHRQGTGIYMCTFMLHRENKDSERGK